jgi:hypothetical protein
MIGLCSKKLFCTARLPFERILPRIAFGLSGELSKRENDVENEARAFCANKVGSEERFAPLTVRPYTLDSC